MKRKKNPQQDRDQGRHAGAGGSCHCKWGGQGSGGRSHYCSESVISSPPRTGYILPPPCDSCFFPAPRWETRRRTRFGQWNVSRWDTCHIQAPKALVCEAPSLVSAFCRGNRKVGRGLVLLPGFWNGKVCGAEPQPPAGPHLWGM